MKFPGYPMDEHLVHRIFESGLWLKLLISLIEIMGGIAAYFVSQQWLVKMAYFLTRGETTNAPHDLVSEFLMETVHQLSVNTRHFTAYYLVGHGFIKLWLITGLLRERLWYYPTALLVFILFIAYQIFRFLHTHSVWLLLLTLIDGVVIVLTWHEYRYLSRKRKN